MPGKPELEIQRLNDEIVGYLLLNRSPPKELVAARDEARAALGIARESLPEHGRILSWPRLPHFWGSSHH